MAYEGDDLKVKSCLCYVLTLHPDAAAVRLICPADMQQTGIRGPPHTVCAVLRRHSGCL